MSYDNPRITLDDSVQEIIIKMSGGNPGALSVLVNVFKHNASIDPDDLFEGLGPILSLDTFNIYDSDIWRLYKGVCGENLERMLMLVRACQLGYLAESRLKAGIDESVPFTPDLIADLDKRVRQRLPKFGKL